MLSSLQGGIAMGEAAIAGGMSYPDMSSIMGNSGIPTRQGALSTSIFDGIIANAGLPPGSRFDTNNFVNVPLANVPIVVPWALDYARTKRYDLSPGQLVFSYEDPSKEPFMEADKQPYWMKCPGALNHYLGTPEAHKLYKDITDGAEMAKLWVYQGLAWTKRPPDGSAVSTGSEVYNFEVSRMSETHDYWYYNRYWNDAGDMKGGLNVFDHVFWIWRRLKRYSFTTTEDLGFIFQDPKDQYQWVVEPYCQPGGYELQVDIDYFGDMNEESDNYHHAHAVHIGKCTEYINRYESNSMGMEVVRDCLFPTEMSDKHIKAFNILPRIQLELAGL